MENEIVEKENKGIKLININKSVYLEQLEELRALKYFKQIVTTQVKTISNDLLNTLAQEDGSMTTKQFARVIKCIQILNSIHTGDNGK